MTEREVMEQIRMSAEDVQIPMGLTPEQIRVRLESQNGAPSDEYAMGTGEKPWDFYKRMYRSKAVTAAALFLVCGIGIIATCRILGGPGAPFKGATGAGGGQNASDAAQIMMATEEYEEQDHSGGESDAGKAAEPKHNAGDLYVVAGNYGEVYDLLDQETGYEKYDDIVFSAPTEGGTRDIITESAEEEAGMDAISNSSMASDLQAVRKENASDNSGSASGFTKTNVVTQGVDESDIIKTDGSYLYILHEDKVRIIDIQSGSMKEAGEISISMDSASARVREMYVDGNVLNLILEREETQLKQQAQGDPAVQSDEHSQAEDLAVNGRAAADVYYMDSDIVTELLTYEISDRSNPVLKGSVTQDGYYKTSRKIGDIVYVFSETYMGMNIMPGMGRESAILEENAGGWIPVVNGSAIAADCIYLPESGNAGLVIASVDVTAPDQTVDQTLIVNQSVDVYVSSESLYLYNADYSGSGIRTQIAKFSLKQGMIDAVGATSAAGNVNDTFAICEQGGKLRLLTTDWSMPETENQLYLFDENLELTGSLKGIAKGEEIYAARFIGNTAYFVTYRNTDPLFAVDLSDEKNPKILSELKITGFSEYLHLWSDDKLFGIGYETDPDTGTRKGIKLTMFDISDPAKLETAGTCVIGNIDYSPALYQYKCVLADPEQNLIGFAAESYGSRDGYSYLLFSWEDGKFREVMTETLGGNGAIDEYRGIYVGDRFYLVSPGEVMAYDRTNGYRRLEKLTF